MNGIMNANCDRVPTGIEGLDDMLGGGFPAGHSIALLGSFGTGKTTFAMQFLFKGLQNREKALFISLEEDKDSIIKNCEGYGWDIKPFIDRKELVIVKLEPSDMKSTIAKIKGDLTKTIRDFGAKRIVVDSISLFNMLFDDPTEKRNNLFNLCYQIKSCGATAIFTAEVKDDNPNSSRDGLMEYVADGVILLKYTETEKFKVLLTLRIVKMRRAQHVRDPKKYEIGKGGITVHSKGDIF